MFKYLFGFLAFCVVLMGCKTPKVVELPEQTITVDNPLKTLERERYNASQTKKFDLIHTKLAVRFNWEKAHLYGKAELRLTPYFYPQDKLVLDARGMNISKVKLLKTISDSTILNHELSYEYDSLKLHIDLEKSYTRKDTLTIFIDYTAKPNELKKGGSRAISSDKGLYFINEKGEDKEKPQQIWTQGETQSNSAWFPTIDAPNQKMTNEIAITVAEKYKTLSNGILTFSELNGDGTRTDFWDMNLPHAPYLVMMAIGDFAVIKDQWKTIDVDYYVEHKYEPYAKDIFGYTPEMIAFYSDVLGVDYPWQKYSQVVVRDFVSGAMENTSAVVHGGFVQQTKRELIDGNAAEDVISHELFHHWFGDLVTCESWANLPLNESFATYGEVLWREHKYGDDKAAEGLQNDLNSYLQSVKRGNYKHMIRFGYKDKEDMFDRHSYQKGGCILHMLRNYMGDDAFFASLKLYLTENKFTDVEMHQLRLACEKITGEDLNWFFNQWFYDKGHPILDINYEYNDSTKTQLVKVLQMQDYKEFPIFKLPVKIDIYVDNQVISKKVVVDKLVNEFSFKVPTQPDLVNFDADKMLLCEKVDNHSYEEWAFMYNNAPRYLDRFEALIALLKVNNEIAYQVILNGLNDKYSRIKRTAIKSLQDTKREKPEKTKEALLKLTKDENSIVRGDAIYTLAEYFSNDDKVKQSCIDGIQEESYYVISSSLEALGMVSYEDALKFAKEFETEENNDILYAVGSVYAEYGTEENNSFFIKKINESKGYKSYGFTTLYGKYLRNQSNKSVEEGLSAIKKIASDEETWWIRMAGINVLLDLQEMYKNRIHIGETELKELKAGDDKELDVRHAVDANKNTEKKIAAIIEELKEKEENSRLLKLLNGEK